MNWSSRAESILSKAIASQSPKLVSYLLRSRSTTDGGVLSKSLLIAVEHGQMEIVSLLVTYGACTTLENLSALRKAVQVQRIDLVLAIMKGVENSERSDIASSVIGDAFSTSSTLAVEEQRLLIDILLCAGAKGDPVAQVLLQVVQANHRSIARLLIKHGADLGFKNAEALRIVVASKDMDMLSTLLLGKVPEAVSGIAVDEIPHTCSDHQTYSMLSLLITKGAGSGTLNRALLQAVQHRRNETMRLLLDHQADVNIENCQPLRMAVIGSDVTSLKTLLTKGRPHPEAMQDLLPLMAQHPLSVKFPMFEAIINAAGQHKINVAILNDTMLDALKRPSQDEIAQFLIPLVDLLITTGASVDVQRGKCFRLAAETGSSKLLELLMSTMSDPTSLSPAVEVSRKMGNEKRRGEFLCTLVKHGARGSEIDQAFVDLIEESSADTILLQLLLKYADFEYLGGRALIAAMRLLSTHLVASIIDTGRTSDKMRYKAWKTLYEAGIKQRLAKATLLLQAGIGQDGLDKALISEIGANRDSQVIRLLLDHKASCDYDGGKSLKLAIHNHDGEILEQLVASRPKYRTVQAMIHEASAIPEVQVRLQCLSLLIRGGANGEPVSQALLQEVEVPGHRDPQAIRFLVDHGATVDYFDGKAIKFVASAPLGVDILSILLSVTRASTLVATLVPIVMKHPQDIRIALMQVLLDHGADGVSLGEALVNAVYEGTAAQPTIELLLKHGASVDHNRAQAIKVAAHAKLNSILIRLLEQNPSTEFLEETLPVALQIASPPSASIMAERLCTVQLLTRNLTKPGIADEPLIQAVREEDNELIRYWIKHGANPNSEDGKSVVIAAQKFNLRSLQYLFRSKTTVTSYTCSRAFAAMPTDDSRWRTQDHLTPGIDRILISAGAAGAAVDQTFLCALKSSHELAARFIRLVLDHHTPLDVNFESGRSLCIATEKARVDVVTYLLQQVPKESILRTAFMYIFESKAEEQMLVRIAQEFFACPTEGTQVYFQQSKFSSDALYQVLHRHSDKPNLLRELLANGCRSEPQFPWRFNGFYGDEHPSTLLWLLCQGSEATAVRLVDVLLDHGGRSMMLPPNLGHLR